MKTLISRALALLLFLVSFCQADVLYYAVNFGPTSQGVTPTGTFTYNTATNLFETFDVTVLIYSFDFSSAANAPSATGELPCLSGLTGAPAFFHALKQRVCSGRWQFENSLTTGVFDVSFSDRSTLETLTASTSFQLQETASGRISGRSVTATEQSPPVPEPTFVGPFGLAIGALAWSRARSGR